MLNQWHFKPSSTHQQGFLSLCWRQNESHVMFSLDFQVHTILPLSLNFLQNSEKCMKPHIYFVLVVFNNYFASRKITFSQTTNENHKHLQSPTTLQIQFGFIMSHWTSRNINLSSFLSFSRTNIIPKILQWMETGGSRLFHVHAGCFTCS